MARKCDICGKRHPSRKVKGKKRPPLSRRQCLLGHANGDGVLYQTLKEACHLRDNHTCVKCGWTNLSGMNQHLSHVIRKSQCGRLKYDLLNVMTNCAGCHRWWHDNELYAGVWFREKYPERSEYLDAKRLEYRQDPGTIPIGWYEEQLDKLRGVIQQLDTNGAEVTTSDG